MKKLILVFIAVCLPYQKTFAVSICSKVVGAFKNLGTTDPDVATAIVDLQRTTPGAEGYFGVVVNYYQTIPRVPEVVDIASELRGSRDRRTLTLVSPIFLGELNAKTVSAEDILFYRIQLELIKFPLKTADAYATDFDIYGNGFVKSRFTAIQTARAKSEEARNLTNLLAKIYAQSSKIDSYSSQREQNLNAILFLVTNIEVSAAFLRGEKQRQNEIVQLYIAAVTRRDTGLKRALLNELSPEIFEFVTKHKPSI